MSRLVAVVNAVRDQCDEDWLTESQRSIFMTLRTGFEHHRVLNVFGEPGSGKTVLAWVLERSGYGIYRPGNDQLPAGTRRLLLDNFPHLRRSVRRLINSLDELQVHQVVVITRRQVDEDVPTFELSLTNEDIIICKANLSQRLGGKFLEETPTHNLHDLLRNMTR